MQITNTTHDLGKFAAFTKSAFGGGKHAAGGAENLIPSSGLTWPPNSFCSDRGDRRAQRNRKPVTQSRTLNTSHTYLLMDF